MGNSNGSGNGEAKMDFQPLGSFQGADVPPDAPDGEWTAKINVEKKVSKTKPNGGGGRPMFQLTYKLLQAHTEGNEYAEGTELNDWLVFYPEIPLKSEMVAARISADKLSKLCEALGIDRTKGVVIPKEVNSWDDLQPLFDAIDGETLPVWTRNKKNRDNENETRVYTTPPRGQTKAADEGDDE